MIVIRTQDRMALYKCSEIFIEELTNYTKLNEFVEKRYEQEEKPIILLVSSFGNKIKREITKAEYISIKTSEFKTKFKRYVITGNEHEYLGTYTTKERALEVLDEIQIAIVGTFYIPQDNSFDYGVSPIHVPSYQSSITALPSVYEMPKE